MKMSRTWLPEFLRAERFREIGEARGEIGEAREEI
jgi:hypothetical protein